MWNPCPGEMDDELEEPTQEWGESLFAEESTSVVPLLSVGSLLADRFRVEAALGTGALSAVFRAVDLQQGELPVALKVLIRRRCDD